ncbi:hypothetical protein MOD67_13925 [Bacillus licheniformis]|nr:hypothetical protein [Bacillus licheniformis]MCY8745079.1 hypothetical protein [Bacillus licheniformis]
MRSLSDMVCKTCGRGLDYSPTYVIISEKGTYCDIACENIDDMDKEDE